MFVLEQKIAVLYVQRANSKNILQTLTEITHNYRDWPQLTTYYTEEPIQP